MSQTIRTRIEVNARDVEASPSGSLNQYQQDIGGEKTWPDGTSTGESDASVYDSATPVAGAIQAIDLTAADHKLDDPNGTVSFSKVKGIVIDNSDNDYEVYVGGGTGGKTAPNADAWSDGDAGVTGSPFLVDGDIITIPAGGRLAWEAPAGVAVPGATADTLGIEQGAGGAGDVKWQIWGDE